MTFRRFIQDHFLHILFWFAGLLLLNLVIWLDPSNSIALINLFYLDLLLLLFLLIFLGVLYWHRLHWYRQLQHKLKDGDNILNYPLVNPESHEEALTAQYVKTMIETHQQVLNGLVHEQNDQREFIDRWVHDIKVPLAAFRLISDDLEDELPENKYLQLVDETERINHYVEQVLYYSRLSHFANDYLIQEYSLSSIINTVVRDNMTYFIQKHIKIDQKQVYYRVLTDQKWLQFILQQIVSNSLKYTPRGGQLTFYAKTSAKGLNLFIEDNGIGIPAADLKRIFDKGFTGKNGRQSDSHATGLGLYLAQKLAQKLGHQLTLTSIEGAGTSVIVHFPRLSYYNERQHYTDK